MKVSFSDPPKDRKRIRNEKLALQAQKNNDEEQSFLKNLQVIKGLSAEENRQRIKNFLNKFQTDQDLSDNLYK